jgi:iron complex outermembrane receptor protein
MENPLLATPRQKLNVGVTYKIKPVSLNLTWQYIDKLYTVTGINDKTTSYNLLNARINYTINKYSEVYLKGENLLNTSYEVNFGYPMPGIMVFGGVNFNL